ncbi:MAG TPA: glycosyltransferase family 39 protein [Candidatus Acidoferrum sp.]|nr:glycosyltransferase family 39 protein [Candidatus Acidoferrum sp.]
MNLNFSWISRHPRMVIGMVLLASLGPFLNKAIHVDDLLFVEAAKWIQNHPADFYGSQVNLYGSATPMWTVNFNPPLMSYFLAGAASLLGWHETALHLAGLAVAWLTALGIYALAQRWCGRPLLATLVAIFTPAFLVSSTTLMCDVLMLGFWVWSLVLWDQALIRDQPRWWRFVVAGFLAGLAVLTKYNALFLLPLLPVLSLLRGRLSAGWLLGLGVPLIMAAGYEWLTAKMYGRGLLFFDAGKVETGGIAFPGGWKALGIISLAFAGGSLLPLAFFAPWLWRRRMLWVIGGIVLGLSLGMVRFGGKLALVHAWGGQPLTCGSFLLQVGILSAAGVHLLLFAASEVRRRQDAVSWLLVLWIFSELFCWAALSHNLSARRLLPIVPAVAILLARRLEVRHGRSLAKGWLAWPLALSAAVSLNVATADCRLANSTRAAAQDIVAKYQQPGRNLWFPGGYGAFQFYMEKLGAHRIDVARTVLEPGDVVAVPLFNNAIVELPPGGVGWVEGLQCRPGFWMNPYGFTETTAAGFYGADLGPVPFAFGTLPDQDYAVVSVVYQTEYQTRPANPRAVEAGGAPTFTNIFYECKAEPLLSGKPESMRQARLATQLERDGKLAEAVQCYRAALAADTNDPVVLNNLAWILATAGQPELRNGPAAVQLARRAVTLTDCRLPRVIETLAAAQAEAGQFSEACATLGVASTLALVTGQKDLVSADEKLLKLYSAGKTTGMTNAP